MEVVVTLGAVELLQQFRRSLIALQQYVPKSHVCIFHADTAFNPSKSLLTVVALARCSSIETKRPESVRTAGAKLWTFGSFASRVCTSRLPKGAHVLALSRHTQTAFQTDIGASSAVRGATATVLSS